MLHEFRALVDHAIDNGPCSSLRTFARIRKTFSRLHMPLCLPRPGDLAVYYEPRRSSGDLNSRGGRQAYFAVATITAVESDPALANHFYARVADYLEFDQTVPFREGDHYYESFLRRDDGKTSKGAFGRAVRSLPDEEFEGILRAGFLQDHAGQLAVMSNAGRGEPPADFERPIIERVIARPFRDLAFTRQIRLAYDNRCAVTGLRLINGGGRPEVQAAHIRPVACAGPDSPRNGLALCGTAHWMFDRGLISIDDDFRILSSSQDLPEDAARLFLPSGRLRIPNDPIAQPHPQFLRWHRENVFKG